MSGDPDRAAWCDDTEAFLEVMAARYAFLAEFPDLAYLAEIEERELRAKAQKLLDDYIAEQEQKRRDT